MHYAWSQIHLRYSYNTSYNPDTIKSTGHYLGFTHDDFASCILVQLEDESISVGSHHIALINL